MTTSTSRSCETLWTLVGTADYPVIVDARTDDDFNDDSRLIPGAVRRPGLEAADWADRYSGQTLVVYCHGGLKISQAAAAWLRHGGGKASFLTGGFQAWRAAGLPLVPTAKLPSRERNGTTVWVMRERPGIDDLACTWLIRRFVDRAAVFLFVEPSQVHLVAERYPGVTPFVVEDGFSSRRGDRSAFDDTIAEFGLETEPMSRLSDIVRGADWARPDLAPEAAGLLAVQLGLSASTPDDLERVERGMAVYDALYRWARGAAGEADDRPVRREVA